VFSGTGDHKNGSPGRNETVLYEKAALADETGASKDDLVT
jgi:hypothetical protein